MSNNQATMELSLESDTFCQLKTDFDTVLNRTIGNMTMKNADEAVLTIKLKIGLNEEYVVNSTDNRKITKPTFKHEISSVMQVKDKVTGELAGDYQLVWDEDEEKYVMRRVRDAQMNIFEDEVNIIVEEDDEDESVHMLTDGSTSSDSSETNVEGVLYASDSPLNAFDSEEDEAYGYQENEEKA